MPTAIEPSRWRRPGPTGACATSSTRRWRLGLEAAETREDRASAQEALAEYRRDGGEAAEAFFGTLAAETRSTYGPDEA